MKPVEQKIAEEREFLRKQREEWEREQELQRLEKARKENLQHKKKLEERRKQRQQEKRVQPPDNKEADFHWQWFWLVGLLVFTVATLNEFAPVEGRAVLGIVAGGVFGFLWKKILIGGAVCLALLIAWLIYTNS